MNNELYHYGVLGMKWGVRRTPGQLGHRPAKKKKVVSEHDDYKNAHSNKNIKTMSDKELRDRLNRLQMEQQYSKLTDSDCSKGRSYLNKVIKAGTTVATITSTGLTVYNNIDRINKIVKKTAKK
ncbi:MAG: hypothetical protein Q4P20_09425 [Eubacteriales bacterium]|nr:hypothetical protein [Eubacteriales bacterium]